MAGTRVAGLVAGVLIVGLVAMPPAGAYDLERGGPEDDLDWDALYQGESSEPGPDGRVPDQVHPPAVGEGEPLEDPIEQAPSDLGALSAPRADIAISPGHRWGRLGVTDIASNPMTAAVRASRAAYVGGADDVVIARQDRWAARAAGASVAAIANGPLLLAPASGLPGGVEDELARLNPQRVHIIGLRDHVQETAGALGAQTWRTNVADDDELTRRAARHAAGLAPPRADAPELAAACPPDVVPRSGLADVVGSHHELAVDCLAWHGVVSGASPYIYLPRDSLTRAEAASLLVRLLDAVGASPPDAEQPFGDVAGSSHAGSIARLAGVGIITGRDATTYAPRDRVRRSELTSLIVRALEYAGQPLEDASHGFVDVDPASAHDTAIGAASNAGIIRGVSDDRFDPHSAIRRDHAAVMLTRALAGLADAGRVDMPDGEAPARPVVLVGANDARRGIGAVNLAAGIKAHVLAVQAGTTTAAEVAADVADLGGGQVWAAASVDGIPNDVVAAVGGQRVSGGGPVTSTARLADLGRSLGLRGAPSVVDADQSNLQAAAVGAYTAGRRGAVAVATSGPALSDWAAERLASWRPSGVHAASSLPALVGCQLREGQERSWRCAERELDRQGYHVGSVDGQVSAQTTFALYAFQKVAGLAPQARFTDAQWHALVQRPTRQPRYTNLGARHIEIDVGRQLVLLFRDGSLDRAFHTSTGKASTPTIRGVFSIYWMRPERRPNGMYRSIFFQGGYALHGYPSVPLYPASAGCARMDDRDAEVLYNQVRVGDRVAVY